MAVLTECPGCHRKWALVKKQCTHCQTDLDKAKRRSKANRVVYWIRYRLADNKQRLEKIGYSVTEAKDRDPSGRKDEAVVAELTFDKKKTFDQLAAWYLNLEKVKALKSYWHIKIKIDAFNGDFGNRLVNSIKPTDLENHQIKRQNEGLKPATIDHELGAVKTMIRKAFNDDLVSGKVLKTFTNCKKTLKRNSNARDRVLSMDEFGTLIEKAPIHIRGILAVGFYGGLRRGEILALTWQHVDIKARQINLSASMTKDSEDRTVPICDALYAELKQIPTPLPHVDQHVFKYKGKPLRDFRAALLKACKDAGIKYGRNVDGGFVFHDLRHSFTTHMRKSGVAESVIMAITGHSTREMFDRYNSVDLEDVHGAVHTLGRHLDVHRAQNVHKKRTG